MSDMAPDPEPRQDWQVNRGILPIDNLFQRLGGGSPLQRCIEVAKAAGTVTLLDARCGAGEALIEAKETIAQAVPIDPQAIHAEGVSTEDYTIFLRPDQRQRVDTGYVRLQYTEITQAQFERPINVAYAHELLVGHHDPVGAVLHVLHNLAPGGVFYCSAPPDQVDLSTCKQGLRELGWNVHDAQSRQHSTSGSHRILSLFTKPLG